MLFGIQTIDGVDLLIESAKFALLVVVSALVFLHIVINWIGGQRIPLFRLVSFVKCSLFRNGGHKYDSYDFTGKYSGNAFLVCRYCEKTIKSKPKPLTKKKRNDGK